MTLVSVYEISCGLSGPPPGVAITVVAFATVVPALLPAPDDPPSRPLLFPPPDEDETGRRDSSIVSEGPGEDDGMSEQPQQGMRDRVSRSQVSVRRHGNQETSECECVIFFFRLSSWPSIAGAAPVIPGQAVVRPSDRSVDQKPVCRWMAGDVGEEEEEIRWTSGWSGGRVESSDCRRRRLLCSCLSLSPHALPFCLTLAHDDFLPSLILAARLAVSC